MFNDESIIANSGGWLSDEFNSWPTEIASFYLLFEKPKRRDSLFLNQMLSEVINLYEQTLLGALSDTPKLADNITLLLTF